MNKYSLLACLIFASFSLAHADETAAERTKGYIGVMGGPVFITSTGGGTQAAYGIHAGYEIAASEKLSYSLGLVYQGTSRTEVIQGVSVDETYSIFGGEFMMKSLEGFPIYSGIRLGTAPISAEFQSRGTTVSLDASSFAYGPFVGASFPINPSAAIGMDVSYIEITSGTTGQYHYSKASGILALFEFRLTFNAPKQPSK